MLHKLAPMVMGCLMLPVWSAAGQDFSEAPELAALVASGQLPPVAKRLPKEPEIVTPRDSIGRYGDTLRFGMSGVSDHEQISNWVGNQGFIRYDPSSGFTEILPNVVKSYEIDETFSTFTFHMREGMRWSDGKLFTADDVLFGMNDIILNPDFGPPPPIFHVNGTKVVVSKIDDLTVEFRFPEPQPWFLHELPRGRYLGHAMFQKEYCSQFHASYNSEMAARSDWRDELARKCGDTLREDDRFANPDRPTLEPWVVTQPYTPSSTRVELRRNPYFWMVDSEGNQLPYADRIVGQIYTDPQAFLLGAIGGNIDFGFRNLNSAANRPVIAQNREAGGYELFETTAIGGSPAVFQLNLTHKDPELRQIFGNRDFRVALSIALDRKEIIETALLGAGEPWNPAPFADNPMYHERYATQNLDFDPDRADALLDAAGLDKRNAEGIRLLPSGRPLRFRVEITPEPPELAEILEMMAMQWRRAGIAMDVQMVERSIMFTHVENNDHDAVLWNDNASWLPGRIPTSLAPLEIDSRWGIAWVHWYKSGGARGEEPPASIKERYRLFALAKAATSFEERRNHYHAMAEIAADEFEVFGITKYVSNYGVRNGRLRNVADSHPDTSQYSPALMVPAAWYLE